VRDPGSRSFLSCLCVSLLLGLTACEPEELDTSRERGDLGRGKFIYECLGDTDPACASGKAVFPQAVAMGSRFALRFAIDRGAQPTVIAAAPSFARTVPGGFEVARVGHLAFLAVNGNREVIDIKHLRSASVAEVRVRRDAGLPEAELRVQPGDSFELTAVPFDAQGVELGGALDYAWSSADSTVLRVDTLPDLSRVGVRAVGPGQTSLVINVEGQEYVLSVISGESVDDAGMPEDGGMGDGGVDGGADGGLDDPDGSLDELDGAVDAGEDSEGGAA
jgi:hypothetical protein